MKIRTWINAVVLLIISISCSEEDNIAANPQNELVNTVDFSLGKTEQKYTTNDGQTREYILYVPTSINLESSKVPLLFSIHGRDMTDDLMFSMTQLDQLAEIDGFIVVYPQSLPINGGNKWNGSTSTSGGLPDDTGFIKGLTDLLTESLNIDSERIYLSGFSNGVFFSFHMLCQFSETYAAIAGAGGGMNELTLTDCITTLPKPVLLIHGTDDTTVPYSEAETALDYWIDFNQTDTQPLVEFIPDTNPSDGSTVEVYTYSKGNNNVQVIHHLILGGGHHWPGFNGNMDIEASSVIWNFLSDFDINGPI